MSRPFLPPHAEDGAPAPMVIADLATGSDLLARLPLNRPLYAAEALCRLLDGLLSTPPPLPVLLELLEQAADPVAYIQIELGRTYLNAPLPLSGEGEQHFRQTLAVWRGLAGCYALAARLVAVAVPDENNHAAQRAKRLALTLQRSLHYLALTIAEHQRARRELPEGLWLDLHGGYASAEELGVALLPVPDLLTAGQTTTTCLATYTTELLVDLAGPYRCPPREQTMIRRWTRLWAGRVQLHPMEAGAALPTMGLDLQRDAGVAPLSQDAVRTHLRRLDTRPLLIKLSSIFKGLEQRLSPAELGLGEDCTIGYCKRHLHGLIRPWSLKISVRKFQRHATSGEALAVTGFESMHYAISGAEFRQPETTVYSRRDYYTLFTFRDQVDPAAALHHRSGQQGFKTTPWLVQNHSANGFRLSCAKPQGRIAHRQLLALRPHDGESYLLAQVSWLMEDRSHGLICGVAVLSGLPRAVAARIAPDKQYASEPYSRAFLLPATPVLDQAPDTLVLPKGWYQVGRQIEINQDGAVQRVQLDRLIADGPDFERASYIVPGA